MHPLIMLNDFLVSRLSSSSSLVELMAEHPKSTEAIRTPRLILEHMEKNLNREKNVGRSWFSLVLSVGPYCVVACDSLFCNC